MKKAFLFLLTFIITFTSFSQTTMEEYNYVIKGYKILKDAGLGDKKGYKMIDVDNTSSGERTAYLKKLLKITGKTRKIVAYLVIYQKQGDAEQYICVPSQNSSQWVSDSYWEILHKPKTDDSERLRLITFLLSRHLTW
ncbi:MAG: hypothetical protein V4556_12245 [Bacteroidota bacterium]